MANVQKLNIIAKFDDEEINIAKKCVVNGLKTPPGFSMRELKVDNRSVFSRSMKSTVKGSKNQTSVYQGVDFQFDDMLLPVWREEGGTWVMSEDFSNLFHFI